MGVLFRFFFLAFFVFIVFLFATKCSTDDALEPTRSVESLYDEAKFELDRENYERAYKLFDEVERQHPYSKWAAKSELMSAYAYYENEKFDDAVMALDRFIQLHPGNKNIPYAYYLKAMCFYNQISDIYRDQKMTLLARDALEEVFRRFPNSAYAKDARIKYDLTIDHLAGKEMAVGRWYLGQELYLAALNRFQVVVVQYQTTTHIEEALYRLVECYTLLGLKADAIRVAAVLGYNYPDGEWYEMAYRIANTDMETIKAEIEKKKQNNDTLFDF